MSPALASQGCRQRSRTEEENVTMMSCWNVTVSRLRRWPARAVDKDLGRRWIEVWRRTEQGHQVVEEESVVFSTIGVGDKHAGPSGLGDLEVSHAYPAGRWSEWTAHPSTW